MKTIQFLKIIWVLILYFYSGSLEGQRLLVCDTNEGYWIYENDSLMFYFELGGPVNVIKSSDMELIYSDKNLLYFQLFNIQKYANKKTLKILNAESEEEKEKTEASILMNFIKKEGLQGCTSFTMERTASPHKLWILQQGKTEVDNQSSSEESNNIIGVLGACSVIQNHILRIITMQYSDQDFDSVSEFLLSVVNSYTKTINADDIKNLCPQ